MADILFKNGSILTMEGDSPSYVECLAVKDGNITYVGPLANAPQAKETRDLQGQCLMPGFLDGHSHFINALSVAQQANCYPAPVGPGSTKEGIIGALKELQQKHKFEKDDLIVAYGYDDSSAYYTADPLKASDLDPHFPDNPVLVQHISLHGAVLNTAAFKHFGIGKDTPTPDGGVTRRLPDGTPEGLLMEMSFLPVFSKLPKPTPEKLVEALGAAQELYASAGITTAHEGATKTSDLAVLQAAAKQGKLYLDVIAYPFIVDSPTILKANPPSTFGKYENRLKLGGIKITIDGSPQGRTAFFTTPYLTGGPGGQNPWVGEPTFPKEEFEHFVKSVYDNKLPLLVHCNGDGAIDWFLEAHEKILGPEKSGDHRSSIIHCQFVRKDQLDKIKDLKIYPSFFTAHVFFFSSAHIKNRGMEQASFISPMASAKKLGIKFSNHTDFNVVPIDQIFIAWTAVNRVSREGQVMGPDERVDAYTAFKALTIDTAWWYREDDKKGSLKVGKLADLVILSSDPVKVAPMDIKDIKVMETIKEGKTIYQKK